MNIREEIEHCIRSNPLNGFDRISEFGIDVLEDLFKKLAKQVCDKQKQICADNSRLIPVTEYGRTYNDIDLKSIINSPYPEELQ